MSDAADPIAQRALAINIDRQIYGTFAEIGAGQEVARWFFSVGGAAGTVAKSMSAYDMKVSDAIYGKAARYVSRERVEEMLDHEFSLLRERLEESRGASTRFFAFADTAAALQNLNLVITVDTAVAHLAGALGRPCWVMLPAHLTDWRWLRERTDSPWYPGVLRLFRQQQPGVWDEVVQSMVVELRRLAQQRQPTAT